jgi:hypothetical protein
LNWISHIFLLKPLKPVFAIKWGTSSLNLKRDYQRFNVKARPIDGYYFLPTLVFAGQYLTVPDSWGGGWEQLHMVPRLKYHCYSGGSPFHYCLSKSWFLLV